MNSFPVKWFRDNPFLQCSEFAALHFHIASDIPYNQAVGSGSADKEEPKILTSGNA
jgi:hypothetical protein